MENLIIVTGVIKLFGTKDNNKYMYFYLDDYLGKSVICHSLFN